MAKKRYEKNPYAYAVVNALCCFARDYADAKADLEINPVMSMRRSLKISAWTSLNGCMMQQASACRR